MVGAFVFTLVPFIILWACVGAGAKVGGPGIGFICKDPELKACGAKLMAAVILGNDMGCWLAIEGVVRVAFVAGTFDRWLTIVGVMGKDVVVIDDAVDMVAGLIAAGAPKLEAFVDAGLLTGLREGLVCLRTCCSCCLAVWLAFEMA